MPMAKRVIPALRALAASLAVRVALLERPSVMTTPMLGTPERSPLPDVNMLVRRYSSAPPVSGTISKLVSKLVSKSLGHNVPSVYRVTKMFSLLKNILEQLKTPVTKSEVKSWITFLDTIVQSGFYFMFVRSKVILDKSGHNTVKSRLCQM